MMKNKNMLKEFLAETKWLHKRYICTNIFSVVLIIIGVIIPIVNKNLIDEGIINKNLSKLLFYFISMIVLSVLHLVFNYIIQMKYSGISRDYNVKTKEDVLNKLKQMSGKDIEQLKSGKLINILEEDVESISNIVTNTLFSLINDSVTALFSLLYLMIMAPWILFPLILIQGVLFLYSHRLSKRISLLNEQYFTLRDSQTSNIQEHIVNIGYLLQSNLYGFFLKRFIYDEKKVNNIMYDVDKNMNKSNFSQGILNVITFILTWGVGGILTISGKLTLGEIYAIEMYCGRFTSPINRIISNYLQFKKMLIQIKRVYSLLYCTLENNNNNATLACTDTGDIEFKNIDFSYNSQKILKNLSFMIHENKVNVIMGKSGQGKTTIIKLLTRYYGLDKGDIIIHNNCISKYYIESLRDQISIVSQDIAIFNATIYENLVLNNSVEQEEVFSVCKLTGIYNEIMDMEKQFDTIITEFGRNLSGGQRQRIGITRALLRKTKIIVFDEPTSGLDEYNKRMISKLIYSLKNTTILLITHDKQIIKPESYIYIIQNGSLKESQFSSICESQSKKASEYV
ncbi:ABC transporter ATP-binding protein [Anaerocolumna jejuensis]|uniref:ABC transporter ATP-binding protein n=1 Tax=Anaerocolumna jejuensis TaxID=259063 RepID=UPI003F7BDCF3